MSVEIRSIEGWTASITLGVWECADAGVERWLQSRVSRDEYVADSEWDHARMIAAEVPGVRIVTPAPAPLPERVY